MLTRSSLHDLSANAAAGPTTCGGFGAAKGATGTSRVEQIIPTKKRPCLALVDFINHLHHRV
jgi:hypothetical protein